MKKNLCNGAGRCLADSCEPDGFKCKCFDKYYGKYCQHEKFCKSYHFLLFIKQCVVKASSTIKFFFSVLDDYDIKFSKNTTKNFVDLGRTDKDVNEFTFSAWIKFNPGFMKYPLVSYISDSTEIFTLAFHLEGRGGETIGTFSGNLFGQNVG